MTVTSIRSFGSTAPVTLAWASGFFSLPGMMVRFRGAAMTSLLQKATTRHLSRTSRRSLVAVQVRRAPKS